MDESSWPVAENKVLVVRLFDEALHQGKLDVVDEIISPDFIDHSTPDQVAGPVGVRDYFIALRAGFPDLHVAIEDVIAERDRVVVRTTWRGTHTGSYGGLAATGREEARTLMQIFRIINGKIVEEWNEGGEMVHDGERNNRL